MNQSDTDIYNRPISYMLIGVLCATNFLYVTSNAESYAAPYQFYFWLVGIMLVIHTYRLWKHARHFRWADLLGVTLLCRKFPSLSARSGGAACLRSLFGLYTATLFLAPLFCIVLEAKGMVEHGTASIFLACQAGIGIVLFLFMQAMEWKREGERKAKAKEA